jgi:rhodanese-related sulfurtransferase
MKKLIFSLGILAIGMISLIGCKKENDIIKTIDSKEAKEIMEQNEDVIILDVRTEEEFREGHIKGAILLPDYEVEEKAEEVLVDKSTTVLVYCRSGRRSASAAKALLTLGYSKIYDFGGIIDWPYEIVTD